MNLRILVGIIPASALVAGGLLLAPSAGADTCNDGAVKPDGGGADGYYTCFGREWIHTVPFHDPNSADGYGPNQTLPPICIRMPKDNPCPTGNAPSAPMANSTGIPGNGTFIVGKEVAPGTYHSVPIDDIGCSWATLRDLDNTPKSMINGNNSTGPIFAVIHPGDFAFTSFNCQPWQRVVE
ncbi:putative secreted protein [Mycobacteroides abscessus subsp. massiliense]|uniref:hypothetical protein n=1 Tax=Mycobacteroides abscessus TaxID=36809 RepID=UPI0009A5E770|nr:hypothetical protein [Mycobacteroides abscessus]SKH54975.1 putative secreted protein [Mycobacteroides abscessus subsp. massiliense]SKH85587.1 putative secreted protein [Mycobacteroides abscessus subsp. massiliense]SKK32559.1 putative secreted protein [Mycobacteroides abscessus subsp. massiliense]SKK47240.1 putative secreted protein [Mycobacteroides abscessus subsp. massiliense]SKL88407.1 putative secreted protein [Mycobacteroides abscessus subsp. massiliense]